MNIWRMRRLSNIQLILGNTTAGTKPTGRGAEQSEREHSTLSSKVQSCPGTQRGISERLGYATTSMTLGTYSHVLPGLDRQAASDIASANPR